MAAVARPGSRLPRTVNKRIPPNRLVGPLIDLVTRRLERIQLNRLPKCFRVARRARIIRQDEHVARRREQVVVPTQPPGVFELRGRAAVHHDEQRIFFLRAKTCRLDQQVGNRPPFRTRKLKPLHRRQIELRHLGIVEVRENLIRTCHHIKARHLGRSRRAIDIRHQHRTTSGQPTHAAILRHVPRLDRASRHRHGK